MRLAINSEHTSLRGTSSCCIAETPWLPHDRHVRAVFRYSSAVACTGRTYSACAAYNYVVIYDRACTRVSAVLRAHSNKVTAVAAAEVSEHEVVLSGGRDKVAIAWSVARQAVVRKQKVPGEVDALTACPSDPNKAILALNSGACVVWDWGRGMLTASVMLHVANAGRG